MSQKNRADQSDLTSYTLNILYQNIRYVDKVYYAAQGKITTQHMMDRTDLVYTKCIQLAMKSDDITYREILDKKKNKREKIGVFINDMVRNWLVKRYPELFPEFIHGEDANGTQED